MSIEQESPAFQRILPGFQPCFRQETKRGRGEKVPLSEDVVGLPADLFSDEVPWLITVDRRGVLTKKTGRFQREPVLLSEESLSSTPAVPVEFNPEELVQAVDLQRLRTLRQERFVFLSANPEGPGGSSIEYFQRGISMRILPVLEEFSDERELDLRQYKFHTTTAYFSLKKLLTLLGVVAFVWEKPGAENFFIVRERRILSKSTLTAGQCKQLLSYFIGEEAIKISSINRQYIAARRIIFDSLV